MTKLFTTFLGLFLLSSSAISTPIVATSDQNDSVIFPTQARNHLTDPRIQNENSPDGEEVSVNKNVEARSVIGKEPRVLLRNNEHFSAKPLHFPDLPEPQSSVVSEPVPVIQPPVPVVPQHRVPVAPHHTPVVQKPTVLKHGILHRVKERLSHLPQKLRELKSHIPLLKTHHNVLGIVQHRGDRFIPPVQKPLFEHPLR